MKHPIKITAAAAICAAALSAFAAEADAAKAEVAGADEGAIGWSPITIGPFSPVQFPWGHCKWDVKGVTVGQLYYGECKIYGVAVGGLGGQTADTAAGVQVAGLMNLQRKTSYGLRVTVGANVSTGGSDYKGVDIGSFAYRRGVSGLDVQLLAAWQENNTGAEISGLFNYTKVRSHGFQGALGTNLSDEAYGCQLAIFNKAGELHGAQIGLVNWASDCQWGFQVGLLNFIWSNRVKCLPFFNTYF